MARRAAPPNSGPSYLPPSSHSIPGTGRYYVDPNESRFQSFLREQIFAPEKLPGNISIVTGVGMFLGGIAVMRVWGEALVGDI
ncbi:hypothetical protein K439DRAFT_817609 [Ramaria rubella]|nr:hypothetical protein K439DRAFT_817609 [Ramaria rubella]